MLITGSGGRWCNAAQQAMAASDLPLNCFRFGTDIEDPGVRWPSVLGVADDGAVLVRPDGFVAWRVRIR